MRIIICMLLAILTGCGVQSKGTVQIQQAEVFIIMDSGSVLLPNESEALDEEDTMVYRNS